MQNASFSSPDKFSPITESVRKEKKHVMIEV